MLDYVSKIYGAWIEYGMVLGRTGTARVSWPGRGEYESEITLYVGPDAARYISCRPPPGSFRGPEDLRSEGVRVGGLLSDGRRLEAPDCAAANLSGSFGGTTSSLWVVLHAESRELSLRTRPLAPGSCLVEWTFVNALFEGVRLPPNAHELPFSRRDTFSFSSGAREWTLRLLPAFGEAERGFLASGAASAFPTATLSARLADPGELDDAGEEAYAIGRLLSLATGASVGGAARRLRQSGSVAVETFEDWPRFGKARKFQEHALIANDAPLGDALRVFLEACLGNYRRLEDRLSLSAVIAFLEEARSSGTLEIRIGLAILAIETLTHQICLADGIPAEKLDKMNIATKLNRLRGSARTDFHMGFIEPRFTEAARDKVRNPLLHTGQIPGLPPREKAAWSQALYGLAFRMLMSVLGYRGKWLDIARGYEPTS